MGHELISMIRTIQKLLEGGHLVDAWDLCFKRVEHDFGIQGLIFQDLNKKLLTLKLMWFDLIQMLQSKFVARRSGNQCLLAFFFSIGCWPDQATNLSSFVPQIAMNIAGEEVLDLLRSIAKEIITKVLEWMDAVLRFFLHHFDFLTSKGAVNNPPSFYSVFSKTRWRYWRKGNFLWSFSPSRYFKIFLSKNSLL